MDFIFLDRAMLQEAQAQAREICTDAIAQGITEIRFWVLDEGLCLANKFDPRLLLQWDRGF